MNGLKVVPLLYCSKTMYFFQKTATLAIYSLATCVCLLMASLPDSRQPTAIVYENASVAHCRPCRYRMHDHHGSLQDTLEQHCKSQLHVRAMCRWDLLSSEEQRSMISADLARANRSFEAIQREALLKENAWIAARKAAKLFAKKRTSICMQRYGKCPRERELVRKAYAIILAQPAKLPTSAEDIEQVADHLFAGHCSDVKAQRSMSPNFNALADVAAAAKNRRRASPPPFPPQDDMKTQRKDEQ